MSQALESPQEQSMTLALAFDQAQEAMFLVDNDLSLKEYNNAFLNFCCCPLEKGLSLMSIAVFQCDACWPGYFSRCLEGEVFSVEQEIGEGEKIFNFSFSPVVVSGKVHGAFVSGKDITKRVKSRRQNKQAEIEAEAVYRAKSEFMANMNHTLRTPLNHIIGYSEMLIEELDDYEKEDIADDLSKINRAGKQLLGLINNIISLARAEAGKSVVAVEVFDLELILKDTIGGLQREMSSRGNDVELTCESRIQVSTDLEKFRHIIRYLLNNASRFSQNTSIHLSAYTEKKGDIILKISDFGKGMTEDLVKEINEFFTKRSSVNLPREDGVGFGLILVSKYCELIGAQVSLISQTGEGSTFTVSLPCSPR